ncbi:DUF2092 domain-containing protein [Corallococcus praedator]|uniref:DUF2092 domain-containing protein n=1 Tax=Corallococcus praedator TaxID=2316724 RepID=A0ABX9Q8I3_9BACT|nr:DUF2092 domain-containing protein [Corallococcus sp. CA031C]RKH92267.1 DUF2092 domain-containing protein [Corallococcus praedator]
MWRGAVFLGAPHRRARSHPVARMQCHPRLSVLAREANVSMLRVSDEVLDSERNRGTAVRLNIKDRRHWKRLVAWGVCAGCMLGWGSPAFAATATREKTSKAAASVEPQAVAALERMGDFLRCQRTFEVTAKTTTDAILDNGQKVQFAGTTDLRARRPDRLRVDSASDLKQRQYFYDGKHFTVNGPGTGFYASFDAPPTLEKTLEAAEQRYDIELPLVDLFYWGTDKGRAKQLKSAVYVGPATVEGVATDQYAFRQGDVDWQVWIEKGERPVPRKFVVTSVQEPSQPQHVATLDWNLKPRFDDASFNFVPPRDAHRIAFEDTRQRAGRNTPNRSR